MSDTHTDGNQLAGILSAFLAADVTRVRRRCQSCRTEHPIAAHRAYHGAGTVLRCPTCEDVAVVIADLGGSPAVHWRGVYRTAAS